MRVAPPIEEAPEAVQAPSPRWIVRGGIFFKKQEVLIPQGEPRFSGRGAEAPLNRKYQQNKLQY